MQKTTSILLLFIIGITLIPWRVLCMAHPFGQDQHKHEGPSPCELHKLAAQQGGVHFLPPMECKHIDSVVDNYSPPQTEKVIPTVQLIAVALVLFDLVNFEIPEKPALLPPEPRCRSATIIADSPFRGPPLIG